MVTSGVVGDVLGGQGLSGVTAEGFVNSFSGMQRALIGVSATGYVNQFNVLFWSTIDDSQNANWSNIDDSQNAGWSNINSSQNAQWQVVETE